MPDEQLGDILEAMRARIQAQLDAQIQALNARHEQALARVRTEAEVEAERRWTSKVDAIRTEWTTRLDSEVAAARVEAEKRFVAESARAKAEAEQASAEVATRSRRELDQAIALERQRASAQLDEQRRQAQQELQQTIAALDAERQRESETAALAGPSASLSSGDVDARAMLDAIATIDGAGSLSDALAALVWAATLHAPRAALFVVNGTQLDEWAVAGVEPLSKLPIDLEEPGAGLLAVAVQRGQRVSNADAPVAAFAPLPADGMAVAVPLMVGGQAVAVLYADEGTTGSGPREWVYTVELLARHGAACLAELTAVRALQLLQSGGNGASAAAASPSSEDDDQSARRYARLLVSEIKLYNETAVRIGREKRDLMQRLRSEIDRARRLYEERVPPSVPGRTSYFHQELVQTLAGGDAGVLGQ